MSARVRLASLIGILCCLSSPAWAREAQTFSGHAHWYGGHFNGRRTASGAVFDKSKMTAAHPSLPFGTRVKVKSLHTGKTVVVVVTDRCPALKQRCIDLSEGAARKLGIYPAAPCKVECIVLQKEARTTAHTEATSKDEDGTAPADSSAM